MLENTIIFFCSDNGPDFGNRFDVENVQRFNCGLRGEKQLVYEGVARYLDYKLVYPPVQRSMELAEEDISEDIDIKNNPEKYRYISRKKVCVDHEINNVKPELYDLSADGFEDIDISTFNIHEKNLLVYEYQKWFNEVTAELD